MSDYVISKEIKPFLDEEGRLTALPGKNKKKLYAPPFAGSFSTSIC